MALTRIDSTGYAGAVWVDAERVAAARRVRSADPRAHAQLQNATVNDVRAWRRLDVPDVPRRTVIWQ